MAQIAWAVLFLLLLGGLLLYFYTGERSQTPDPLTTAAAALAGASDPGRNEATGRAHDVPVTFRLALRRAGKSTIAWTEIDSVADSGDLVLSLRPESEREHRVVAEKLAVDLQTGDAAFDAAFVVEGAPKDLIIPLLSADVRARLLAVGGVTITQWKDGLRLEQRGYMVDPERIRAAIEAIATLSAALPGAREQAARAVAEREGTDYRGEVSADREQAVVAARALEVAQVKGVQQERARVVGRRRALLMLVWVAIVAAAALAMFHWR